MWNESQFENKIYKAVFKLHQFKRDFDSVGLWSPFLA